MPNNISPWGPVGLLLAGLGLVAASLGGATGLALTLAALGLLAAVLGLLLRGTPRDRGWPAVAGAVSGGVLGLVLFAPGLFDPGEDRKKPAPQTDPNQLVRVSPDRPLEAGSPLDAREWLEAPAEGIRQDDLLIAVKSARVAEWTARSGAARLQIHLVLYQVRPGRTIVFDGFGKDRSTPVLTDGAGHGYPFVGHQPQRFSSAFDLVPLHLDHLLIFEMPPAGTASLKLVVPASAWGRRGECRFHIKGIEREPPVDPAAEVARWKRLLNAAPRTPPDVTLGRALFVQHCQECHTLFGVGAKVGPDLTASKRSDRDFLVTSIINPSAEFAKGFEPKLVFTDSGRIVTGIIRESTADALTVQGAGEKVVVPRKEIEEIQDSKVSIMPTELLKPFDEHDVRSLIAYLSGTGQVPILARPENVLLFSKHGQDLNTFQRVRGEWSVEQGEIVARCSRAGSPPLLASELVLADPFRLTLRFHPGKVGWGAVVLEGKDASSPAGPRVEFVAGSTVRLAASDGRQVPSAGSPRVIADAWNRLEINAAGQRLEVRLNGTEAGVLADAGLAGRCAVALEGSGVAGQEVRFAQLDLQVLPADRPR